MMLRPAVLLVAAAIGLFVLLEGTDGGGSAGAATSRPVVVRYDKTGGIAGVEQHVTVRADRRVTVATRGAATTRHTLRAATLRALRRTLDAAHLERPLPATPTGCADCFGYAIAYRGHRASFDEVSVPARMAKAVRELQRIAAGGR